ncbi:MAG: hypothetical protein IPM24_17795 [Bryobacterales bacterium]|nr:hypothetical protein [Bryobacterales bacterium]
MTYDLTTHRHRFAVWAAARAAQRGFTNVDNLRLAVESCGIVKYVRERAADSILEEDFRRLHRECCHGIMTSLNGAGVAGVSYGRAAKLVAIYLKTSVVLGGLHECDLARVAHPPIDGILLRNLSVAHKLDDRRRGWRDVRWTQLTEEQYEALVGELRDVLPRDAPLWHLEEYWTVTDK